MGGHKELHKQQQHKFEELHANPIQKPEASFSAGIADAPLQKSLQASRVPLPANADEELEQLQQAIRESKASYQEWVQERKEYARQIRFALEESELDIEGMNFMSTTTTTTTGKSFDDDSDYEDAKYHEPTTTATTTTSRWYSEEDDDNGDESGYDSDEEVLASTTTAATTTTSQHTDPYSDETYEQTRRQSEYDARQQVLSEEEYEANIAKAIELSLQEERERHAQLKKQAAPESLNEQDALQQALKESEASHQQWLQEQEQEQKEFDAQIQRAMEESLHDAAEDVAHHAPKTTTTTTKSKPVSEDSDDDSDDEVLASTTTTRAKSDSDDDSDDNSDDNSDAEILASTTTTTTTTRAKPVSDDDSDDDSDAEILASTTTTTTTTRVKSDSDDASEYESEYEELLSTMATRNSDKRLEDIYAQSAAKLKKDALNAKIKPYLPYFPKLHDSQLAGMGKIRRTIYRVKRHYYRKRKAKAKKAIMSILQMRNEPQWRPDPTMVDLFTDVSQRLNAFVGMNEIEMQNYARYYAAWKDLLIANKAEQAIGALQCFGTITAHRVGVKGKFQYHELINAYLASGKKLKRMPLDMANKLRSEPYLMEYADAIEKGMRYATMPHNVVMQKVMSVDNFADILGVQPDQVSGEVSKMAKSNRTFVSSGVTMASISPLTSDQPLATQPIPYDEGVEMVILAHKGTNGIPFSGTELNQFGHNQNSYALAPNTVFRVISVQKERNPLRIFVETVPQNDHLGR